MRVAIVSPYDPRPASGEDPLAVRGGVEEALDRMAAGLASRGHEVCLVASAAEAGEEKGPDGVRRVRVRRRGVLFRNPLAPLHAHVPEEADVVHVPATYPFLSDLIPAREARRGRATVVDYHFDVHGTGPAMELASRLHRALLVPLMFRATTILCKSLDYAAHSPVLSRAPAGKLRCVPNGVAVEDFRLDVDKGEDILCVGRLVPYKGVDVLLRAMPRVHRETGAWLNVVGSGPRERHLKALADRLDAPVRFLGRVDGAELRHLYAQARVTVLPSANGQEAFGITLLESMASGTPVVASDLPGVREVASLAGCTAPAGDPRGLAAAIIAAWESPEAFGTPAQIRARARDAYSWESVVARLESAYADALGTSPREIRPFASLDRQRPAGGQP